MRYFPALVFCGLVMSGCVKSSGWINSAPERNIDYSSEVQWLGIPADSIGDFSLMAACSDYILWSEESNDRPLAVYDIADNGIYRPLKKGRAHGELLNINQLISGDGGFAIADNYKNVLSFYEIGNADTAFVPKSEVDISDFSTVAVAGDTIVGILSTGTGRYGIRHKDTIKTFGDYSAYGIEDKAGWGLLQGHVCLNGRLGRLACFSYYTAAYEIVDYRDMSVVSSTVLEMSRYDNNGGQYVTMRPESKVGFIAVTANDGNIFALYDGTELSYYMSHRGMRPRGYDLLVFDWDGKYVERLHSCMPIAGIAWNESAQALFMCVVNDGGEYSLGRLPVLSKD